MTSTASRDRVSSFTLSGTLSGWGTKPLSLASQNALDAFLSQNRFEIQNEPDSGPFQLDVELKSQNSHPLLILSFFDVGDHCLAQINLLSSELLSSDMASRFLQERLAPTLKIEDLTAQNLAFLLESLLLGSDNP